MRLHAKYRDMEKRRREETKRVEMGQKFFVWSVE
jgi:hypothetical protein